MAKSNPVKAEAVEVTEYTFEYDGTEYTFQKDDLNDVEVTEYLEDRKMVSLVRRVLGDAQWTAWKSVKRTNEDFQEFCSEMFKAVTGASLPE